MKSIKKLFVQAFYNGYAGETITLQMVLVCLAVTALISLYIFFVYRVITRKTFYSKTFNLSLGGVALITSAIIITIQSNLVISLGMVGALSIVRFRTAVKDPIDLMFLFWAISTGIICGAGLAEFAVALAVVLTIFIVVMDKLPISKSPMILIVNSSDIRAEERIVSLVKGYAPACTVKSRNLTAESLDLTVEVRTARGCELVQELMQQEGIRSASLLSHDGEVTF